jgi:hypothetical protein
MEQAQKCNNVFTFADVNCLLNYLAMYVSFFFTVAVLEQLYIHAQINWMSEEI